MKPEPDADREAHASRHGAPSAQPPAAKRQRGAAVKHEAQAAASRLADGASGESETIDLTEDDTPALAGSTAASGAVREVD